MREAWRGNEGVRERRGLGVEEWERERGGRGSDVDVDVNVDGILVADGC